MEAATVRAPRPGREPRRAGAAQEISEGLMGPVRATAREVGEFMNFAWRTIVEVPGVWRYSGEVLRQAGILITGTAAVIWFMQFVMGTTCGMEGNYVLRGYGASGYSGVLTGVCAIREMGPYMWGYILAAKVGCGLVAEIGSMRINDELDAMESMGLNPMRYICAARLVAAAIVFPPIYLIGLGLNTIASYLVIVVQIGEVSHGAWETVHWAFQEPIDYIYSLVKIMTTGLGIVLVGMYYGYTAKGGPVGVGTATARSMILSLVMIHLFGAFFSTIFWGFDGPSPIGG
jgi:phospholipid/cholesterol/gamma-HCH transport system permease protein